MWTAVGASTAFVAVGLCARRRQTARTDSADEEEVGSSASATSSQGISVTSSTGETTAVRMTNRTASPLKAPAPGTGALSAESGATCSCSSESSLLSPATTKTFVSSKEGTFGRSVLSEESTFTLNSVPDELRDAHVSRFNATRHGALSCRVFPESEANKEKKRVAIAPTVQEHRPLSRVRVRPVDSVDAAAPNVKIVHFLRHGEGTSNSAARLLGKEQYKSEEWTDAKLTPLGKEQAKDMADYIAQRRPPLDLVLVSPLRRAADTGCLAWAARAAATKAPFVAMELLRERAHGNPCDWRSQRAELQAEWACVDFGGIPENDPLKERHAALRGETWLDTAERAREFLEYLIKRDETHVAVVTHSAFLLTLFNIVLDTTPEDSGMGERGGKNADPRNFLANTHTHTYTELTEWFETGELRSVALVYPEANA